MHPAFSVILFTTLSGSGLGLWFWLALRIATARPGRRATTDSTWPTA